LKFINYVNLILILFLFFRQYLAEIRTVAKAFIHLGLEPRHSVCVLGYNSVEWFLSDLAAIFAG